MGNLSCKCCGCSDPDEYKMNTNQRIETDELEQDHPDYAKNKEKKKNVDYRGLIIKIQNKFRQFRIKKQVIKELSQKENKKKVSLKTSLKEVQIEDFKYESWDRFFNKINVDIADLPDFISKFYDGLFESYDLDTKIIHLKVDDFKLKTEELFEVKFKLVIIKMISFCFNLGAYDKYFADLKVFNEEVKLIVNKDNDRKKSEKLNIGYSKTTSQSVSDSASQINQVPSSDLLLVGNFKKTDVNVISNTPQSRNSKQSNGSAKYRIPIIFQDLETVSEPLEFNNEDRNNLPKIFHQEYNKEELEKNKSELKGKENDIFDEFKRRLKNVNKNSSKNVGKKYTYTFKYICEEIFRNDKENVTEEKFIFNKDDSTYYKGTFHVLLQEKYGFATEYMINPNAGIKYKYKGFFLNNKFNGYGILQKEGNYLYYGEFRNGIQCGYGTENTELGSYTGLFVNGKPQGYGKFFSKGKKYEYKGGHYLGSKQGLGYLVYDDSSWYLGNFKANKMNGLGYYCWNSGHLYFGCWKDDKMHGIGKYVWPTGDIFIGPYEDDKKHGEGTYIYVHNNAVLKGIWKNGKKEGKFILREGNNKFTIRFKKDQQVDKE